MAAIRHASVHIADSAGTAAGTDVLELGAVAIRDVLAHADVEPSDLSALVIASSGVLVGGDPAEQFLENAFANRLVHELACAPGLLHAVPVAVGLLGEPLLTTGVLTARALLLADRLDHAMVLVVKLGEPGAVGTAAFLVSAEEVDGLLIQHVDVITGQGQAAHRLQSPPPDAGMVEVSLPRDGASVHGVLESMSHLIDATVTHGNRAVLTEGSAHGFGVLRLERL